MNMSLKMNVYMNVVALICAYYMLFVVLQAGIRTGYQEKPCLNTSDIYCPVTAPNRVNPNHVSNKTYNLQKYN